MTFLPRRLALLADATLPDGAQVDVVLVDDEVAAVVPAGTAERPADPDAILDLTGHLLLTAPADPHAHLDKALSWDAIRPPMGDLGLAIASWRAYAATMTEDDIAGRARAQALRMLAQGTTAIRSHVDILLDHGQSGFQSQQEAHNQSGTRGQSHERHTALDALDPLRGVRALLRVRDELRDLVDLELVTLAGPDVPDADIESALDLGVDLVGGSPHLATDPSADLRRLLAIADRRGVGVDLHTDESLAGAVTLGEFAAIVEDWIVPVSAGHCVRLGTLDTDSRDDIIRAVKRADIGIIANPITNLYLQGWDDPVSTPRGLTAVRELLDAGVRLAAGADNVRDPFNPLGRGDALETVMLLVAAGHLTIDEAYAAVSDTARSIMSLPQAGAVAGAKAEFLAVRGSSLADVIATAPADRFVIHRGCLVAQSETTTRVAPTAPPESRAAQAALIHRSTPEPLPSLTESR